jgi:glutamine synthetase type III
VNTTEEFIAQPIKQGNKFSVLIATVRWSISREEVVYVVNDFITNEVQREAILEALQTGYKQGVQKYEEANAEAKKVEEVDEKVILSGEGKQGAWAMFATEEDAKIWAIVHAPIEHTEVEYVSFERDSFVHRIVGMHREKTGEALDGLWVATISA